MNNRRSAGEKQLGRLTVDDLGRWQGELGEPPAVVGRLLGCGGDGAWAEQDGAREAEAEAEAG
jgi:hypothetical protein